MATDIHQAIEAVWRIESPRLIAGIARMVRDVGLAEDLAQDALVAAFDQWPASGIPDRPGAWLMSTAKRRAIDLFRRDKMLDRKHEEIGYDLQAVQRSAPDLDSALDDPVGDDMLRLIFTACHPVLAPEARAALTLRLVGGLTTPEIARAFLVPEPTMAQRIVRAKKTLSSSRVPYEVPRGPELVARVAAVLGVLYLIFNEGYAATSGDDWLRPDLCNDALRLGRVLSGLMPDNAEVHGLLALMEIQASRARARVDGDGAPILLLDQDRTRWDHAAIQRGLSALARAELLDDTRGTYTLQAALAACHARAPTAGDTDWRRIIVLYDVLNRVAPSPVIELNRAVAVSMVDGPAAALELVDAIAKLPALKHYHLVPAVRAEMLSRLQRRDDARAEFERAAAMTTNVREQQLLRKRALSA